MFLCLFWRTGASETGEENNTLFHISIFFPSEELVFTTDFYHRGGVGVSGDEAEFCFIDGTWDDLVCNTP
jgi:hypothetical protein